MNWLPPMVLTSLPTGKQLAGRRDTVTFRICGNCSEYET